MLTSQRAYPTCGGDRQCVVPHVTEVIELLPPEVVLRRDIREQLRYSACKGQPVRHRPATRSCPTSKLGLGIVGAGFIRVLAALDERTWPPEIHSGDQDSSRRRSSILVGPPIAVPIFAT